MKRFILLVIFCLSLFAVQAQQVGVPKAFVNDTTTNTETEYMVIASPVAINSNYCIAININGVNASGTATVTASIQVSNDNSVWYNYGTAITLNNAGTVSPYAWYLPDTPWKYYRLRCISSGTGVTNLTGHILLKYKR